MASKPKVLAVENSTFNKWDKGHIIISKTEIRNGKTIVTFN